MGERRAWGPRHGRARAVRVSSRPCCWRTTRRSARRSWARAACCGCRHALVLLGVPRVGTPACAAAGLTGREGNGVAAARRARAKGRCARGRGCGCFHRSGLGARTAQRAAGNQAGAAGHGLAVERGARLRRRRRNGGRAALEQTINRKKMHSLWHIVGQAVAGQAVAGRAGAAILQPARLWPANMVGQRAHTSR